MNFAKAIKVLRVSRELSQGDLARAASISPSYLCLLEAGERNPSDRTIAAIAGALDVPTGLVELLGAEKRDLDGLPEGVLAEMAKLLLEIVREFDPKVAPSRSR
jgi:transcriptional regulator with XRE-family HTH domain